MNFLAMMCLLGCIACGSEDSKSEVNPENNPPQTSDVKLLITSGDKAFDLTEKQIDFSKKDPMSPNTIKIDPSIRYQSIDGFGAAVTVATAFNMSLMPEDKRNAFIYDTFSPEKYGFSYVRVSIGCSDFSFGEYSCCDTPGIENFALTSEDTQYVIPMLKKILEVNPNLKILGSPWSCPKWMKVKSLEERVPFDSWTDGQLNPDYYQDYAQYFVKWIKAFNEAGINIYSITPQNEPLCRGNSCSLYMGWEEERDFIKNALGPALYKAGLQDVKIYAFDHNYNYDNTPGQSKYPLRIYEDAEASKYFAGAAYHNYGGDKKELLKIHEARPDKELIFSEASIGEWNSGHDLNVSLVRDMEELALGTVNNWCKASIMWNLMLDSDKGPHGSEGACSVCYGAVDIDNDTYTHVTRNSHYYIMAHMASVVKPGATRIKSEGVNKEGLTYAAFENLDGTYALVVCNSRNIPLSLTVHDGKHNFSYNIPGKAVVSYRWNK